VAYPVFSSKAVRWLNLVFKNVYAGFGTDWNDKLRDRVDVEIKAANGTTYTLTTDDCGKCFATIGALGYAIFNLPVTADWIGKSISFYVGASQNLDINPRDGTTILALTNAAGDAIRNATAGGFIRLRAVNSTSIMAEAATGTWADVD